MFHLPFLHSRKNSIVTILLLALNAPLNLPLVAAEQVGTPQEKPESVYTKLAKLHLPSLEKQRIAEDKSATELDKVNAEKMQNILTLASVQLPTLGEVEKLQIIYKIFDQQLSNNAAAPAANVLNENVLSDVEMFCGYTGNQDNHVLKAIDHTVTSLGKIQLQRLLFEPLHTKETIEHRQAIIQTLVQDEELFNTLQQQLARIKEPESEFLWLWKNMQSMIDQYMAIGQPFKFFDIHKSATAAEISKWTKIVLYSLTTFGLGMKINKDYNDGKLAPAIGYSAYMLLMVYMFFTECSLQNNIRKTMHQKMNGVATLCDVSSTIGAAIAQHATFNNLFPAHSILTNKVQQPTPETEELLELLKTGTFTAEPSFFTRQGRVIAAYNLMHEAKDKFLETMQVIGQLDAYLSIAKLYKKYTNHPRVHFSFVTCNNASKPYLKVTNFWHPLLNPDTVVTNNIELGTETGARDTIITGPNAGGKSTALKALTLCVLLAQSFGIAAADSMEMTPFTKINTYMNITDATGTASLFQAEMRRTSKLLSMIKERQPNEFVFVVMDEIFTGTNAKEGQAGAYGVAQKLAGFGNTIALFATHFKVLTELAQVTHGVIENRKVCVIKNADGSFTFPYRLEEGITDQAIALDLLQQEGFDNDIVQAAQEIMHRENKALRAS